MCTVYRIEHYESEKGPYNHTYAYGKPAVLYTHSDGKDHPNALEDGLCFITEEYLFGFNTAHDLFTWFNDCIAVLYDHGFTIAAYKTQYVYCGKSNKQVVFIPMYKERIYDMLTFADLCSYKGV